MEGSQDIPSQYATLAIPLFESDGVRVTVIGIFFQPATLLSVIVGTVASIFTVFSADFTASVLPTWSMD